MKQSILAAFTFLALGLISDIASAATAPLNDGVSVGKKSTFTNLVPAGAVEQRAAQQYDHLIRQAVIHNALASEADPQLLRLRAIAHKILPFTVKWNERANSWRWEVNLIGSREINAFCMPGGKIAFFSGTITSLKLTDNEIAVVMGHEMAHALREHTRELLGKETATQLGANLISQAFGFGNLGNTALNAGVNMLSLKFSRNDELEADVVGLELAARGGFNPEAGITLWQKMQTVAKNAPLQWFSTHPASDTRIRDIKKHLPEVMPLFLRANGQSR